MSALSVFEVLKRVLQQRDEAAALQAAARQFKATLWTQDAEFDGVPGVRFVTQRPAP